MDIEKALLNAIAQYPGYAVKQTLDPGEYYLVHTDTKVAQVMLTRQTVEEEHLDEFYPLNEKQTKASLAILKGLVHREGEFSLLSEVVNDFQKLGFVIGSASMVSAQDEYAVSFIARCDLPDTNGNPIVYYVTLYINPKFHAPLVDLSHYDWSMAEYTQVGDLNKVAFFTEQGMVQETHVRFSANTRFGAAPGVSTMAKFAAYGMTEIVSVGVMALPESMLSTTNGRANGLAMELVTHTYYVPQLRYYNEP